MIQKLTRNSVDFYALMGPFFGSRRVEKDTRDRFYDDEDKTWYIRPGLCAASLRHGLLRNFWAANDDAADELIAALLEEAQTLSGIASDRYEGAFRRAGFLTHGYRRNFIEVVYRPELAAEIAAEEAAQRGKQHVEED